MPFRVPAMPLLCDIWTGPWLGRIFRLGDVPCGLAVGRRVTTGAYISLGSAYGPQMSLLVAAGTDVRDSGNATGYDMIEVPAASGRWYAVGYVDDAAKGFPNEFRFANLFKACEANSPPTWPGLDWPTPIP